MRIKQLLIAVGIGTMLAACSSDDTTLSLKKDRTIHINAGISGSLVKTKAVENDATLQNTQFYENETAMFYFWKANTLEFINTVESDLCYIIKSGSFDFCGISDGAVYPEDGTAVDVFALYPWTYYISKTETKDYLTREATTFFVAQDQSTDEGYRMSDLMYAFSAGNTIDTDPVELTFHHCLTKIIVRLPDTEEFNNATVKMKNVQLDKTLDFSDRTKVKLSQPASPTMGDISLGTYTTGNPLSAIVVPQTINPGTTIFEITLADATVYECKSSYNCYFESNNVYTFNLTSHAITSSNVNIEQWSHMDDDTNVRNEAIDKQ